MKRYYFENNLGKFTIDSFDNGTFSVWGNIKAAEQEFRKIHRRPPNSLGNFFGYEKAGYKACAELIESKIWIRCEE